MSAKDFRGCAEWLESCEKRYQLYKNVCLNDAKRLYSVTETLIITDSNKWY